MNIKMEYFYKSIRSIVKFKAQNSIKTDIKVMFSCKNASVSLKIQFIILKGLFFLFKSIKNESENSE